MRIPPGGPTEIEREHIECLFIKSKMYFEGMTVRSALSWIANQFNTFTKWRVKLSVGPLEAGEDASIAVLFDRGSMAYWVDEIVEYGAPGCEWDVVDNMFVVRKVK